jgi:hypothetical protein
MKKINSLSRKLKILNNYKVDSSMVKLIGTNNRLLSYSRFNYRNFNSNKDKNDLNDLNNIKQHDVSYDTTIVNESNNNNKEIFLDKKLFVNGRFKLVRDAKVNSPSFVSVYQFFISGLGVYLGYRAVLKFFKFQFFRGILYSIGAMYLANNYNVLKFHKQMFIYNLNLLEDGKRVEIMLYNQSIFIVDISAIRPLNETEKTFYATLMSSKISASYYPIVINEKLYCFYANNIQIFDREVFDAVKNSKYINVKEGGSDMKDNIIDLE